MKAQIDGELDAINKEELLYEKQLQITKYKYPVSLLACKSVGFILPLCVFGIFIGPFALFPAFYGWDRAQIMFVKNQFPQIKK
jgi:hypothetical protein